MNIHEEAEREREYNAEANRLMEGGGCWIAEDNVTGDCKGVKTQNGAHDCKSCPAYNCFYQTANGYASEDGITWSEAIWLTKQFYDIPTVYMCNGENGDWMKEHDPKKYAALLKRQKELMNGTPDEPEELEEEPAPKATGQMSIMDWFAENN